MTSAEREFPDGAYNPSGVLYWKLPSTGPGKMGLERKVASWLFFNKEVRDTFTLPEIRKALGTQALPAQDEHANRRLRKLREDGWEIPSHLDDRKIKVGEYRLVAKGWHPGQGPRPKKDEVSLTTRREVIVRDGSRCKICGVGDGEPYPGEPKSKARMTVGHRTPRARGGSNNSNNLRAECQRCNEPVKNMDIDPETYEEVLPTARSLKREEKAALRAWLVRGERERSKLDVVYDRARKLSNEDVAKLIELLK